MSETIKVFISSKQGELDTERAILAEQARQAGLEPVLAEEWPPSRNDIRTEYMKRVRDSPIYIGIFYRAYSAPSAEEYNAAIEHPYREVLIYQRHSDPEERDKQLTSLLQGMAARHVYFSYQEPEDLIGVASQHLKAALVRMLNRLLSIGETKGGLSWGVWPEPEAIQSPVRQFLGSLGFVDGRYQTRKAVELSQQINLIVAKLDFHNAIENGGNAPGKDGVS